MISSLVRKSFQSELFTGYSTKFVAGILGPKLGQVNRRIDYRQIRRSMKEEVLDKICSETNLKSNKRSFDKTDDVKNGKTLEETNKKPRFQKKKKFAILLSYSGQNYLGMQFNHGFKTVEGELFQAFMKLEIMDDESFKSPQTVHFQRAARTDKGVSAVRQVISLKIRTPDEDLVNQLNSLLPNCIKVFAMRKVTGGFNSKIACDSRSYSYVMPTFAFTSKEVAPTHGYRVTSKILDEVNSLLSVFKGTRNYHNFTSGRPAQDPSCKRYITQFSCGDPFMIKEVEFVKITIKGQSFMLHQIRKMIGLTISVMRGFVPREILDKAFKMERVNVPTAPSLNLLLEEPHYDSYNRRYGGDGIHETLDWSSFDKDIEKFCGDFILPVIYNGEMDIQNGSMITWLLTCLPIHTYEFPPDSSEKVTDSTLE